MDIRATDTCLLNVDADMIFISQFRYRAILKSDLLQLLQHESWVLQSQSLARVCAVEILFLTFSDMVGCEPTMT